MKKWLFVLAAVMLMVAQGCQKNEEYTPEPYSCDCGSVRWGNVSYPLLDANYILVDTNEFFTRRYYITANTSAENSAVKESVSLIFEFPSVTFPIFNYLPEDPEFACKVFVRNDADSFFELREFVPVAGEVLIDPALAGGSEKVVFDLSVREIIDGDTIGLPQTVKGNFTVFVGN
jgi:hypothetical protein